MSLADENQEEPGIPEWVVTFGDMMSLLLTFFVLLFSMSEVKQEQSMALMESLRRQFGNARAPLSLMPGSFPASTTAQNKYPSLGRARRLNTLNGGDKVRAPVGDYSRVMAVRPARESALGGVVFFEEGNAELSRQAKQVLKTIAEIVAGKPQKIEVRGHASTKPLPPDSSYANHWQLAYARAFNAMQYLIGLGVEPKRIRLAVAGQNEPLDTKPEEAARRRNARVEVYLLDQLSEDVASPP